MSKQTMTPAEKTAARMLQTIADADAATAGDEIAKRYHAARVKLAVAASEVALDAAKATRAKRASAAIDEALAASAVRVKRAADILAAEQAERAAGLVPEPKATAADTTTASTTDSAAA